MKAQRLYDLRDGIGFCSGEELHKFFAAQTGDPSPKGSVEVDDGAALKFVSECEARIAMHAPSQATFLGKLPL